MKNQTDTAKKTMFSFTTGRLAVAVVLCFALLCGVGGASRAQTAPDALVREVARLRADLRQIREDQVKLLARIEDNRRQLEVLARQMKQLEMRLGTGRDADTATARLQGQIDDLKRALQQEAAARKQAEAEMIATVSGEIAAAVNRAASARVEARPDAGRDIQGEYTVQRGDTLGAIALAFGTTVRRLREANNLQGDLIVEGQKLLIPK